MVLSSPQRPRPQEHGSARSWVHSGNAALLTDLYELKMVQAYLREGLTETAVFDLFARRLPETRNFLVAAGLDDALHFLETLSFSEGAREYLASLPEFDREFADALAGFRFEGDVYAVPEGTVVFANEPILAVIGPLPQAQLVEAFLLNQIHYQTLVASKAARVVQAAGGKPVIEFGLRRTHGTDAGMKAARAAFIGGAAGTSNVLAAQVYDIPASGTMAHSYIEAHENEAQAFREYASLYPETVLLADTYDTLAGVSEVVRLAAEMGQDFHVSAIRLDSGDLLALSKKARAMLDAAGLQRVGIVASSDLDEYAIAHLEACHAPIDAYAVGTRMGVSEDAPYFDSAYKLTEYAGRGRMKLSSNKSVLPGRKQVFRAEENGIATGDTIARHDERLAGRPLLVSVMRHGQRLPAGSDSLRTARDRAAAEIAALPANLRSLEQAQPPYPVHMSAALEAERALVRQSIEKTRRQRANMNR